MVFNGGGINMAPSSLDRAVTAQLRALLEGEPDKDHLNAALRLLAKWRAQLVSNTIIGRDGRTVQTGPFKGMDYAVTASEGGLAPRMIGCYEAGIAPVLEQIIAAAPARIIDVGSAEGYYAVGLARRLPDTEIWARDADPKARDKCAALAQANGVAGRVRIGAEIGGTDFDICTTAPTVVICDIEGAEDEVLDPTKAPGLLAADILVEVHEGMKPGLLNRITARFRVTHSITRLDRAEDAAALPDWMQDLSDMDRLIALWEWRAGPTPWLWMTAKARG